MADINLSLMSRLSSQEQMYGAFWRLQSSTSSVVEKEICFKRELFVEEERETMRFYSISLIESATSLVHTVCITDALFFVENI